MVTELPDVESNTRVSRLGAIAAVGPIISIAGAGFIFAFWSSEQQRDVGILRAGIFVGVMAAVSVAGICFTRTNPSRRRRCRIRAAGLHTGRRCGRRSSSIAYFLHSVR